MRVLFFELYDIYTGEPFYINGGDRFIVTPFEWSFTEGLSMTETECTLTALWENNDGCWFQLANDSPLDNKAVAVREGSQDGDVVWYGRIDTVTIASTLDKVTLHAHGISSMFRDMQMSYEYTNALMTPSTSGRLRVEASSKFGVLDKMCAAANWQSNGTMTDNCFPHSFTPALVPTGTGYVWEVYKYAQKNAYDAISAYADNIDVPPFIFTTTLTNQTQVVIGIRQVTTRGVVIGGNSLIECGDITAQNTETRANIFVNNQLDSNGVSKILYTCRQNDEITFFARETTDHTSLSSVNAALTTLSSIPQQPGFTWNITLSDDMDVRVGDIVGVKVLIGEMMYFVVGFVEKKAVSSGGTISLDLSQCLLQDDIDNALDDPSQFLQYIVERTSTSTSILSVTKTLEKKTRNNTIPRTVV